MSDLGYRGPAVLDGVPVEVRLSARFEPLEGRFRWAGRTGPSRSLCDQVAAGLRSATLVLPGAEQISVRVSEPDPWGGVRLSGTGTPPWFRAGP
ncbi:DUF4873 domain-containing protein [Actinoplanes sp. NPDC051343]|uniref:DUF4873 domain-containing protein n=1 Tax=Actinoplanes sp. NPDC051343 TaxID=3363906 RepID=UPI0037959583